MYVYVCAFATALATIITVLDSTICRHAEEKRK